MTDQEIINELTKLDQLKVRETELLSFIVSLKNGTSEFSIGELGLREQEEALARLRLRMARISQRLGVEAERKYKETVGDGSFLINLRLGHPESNTYVRVRKIEYFFIDETLVPDARVFVSTYCDNVSEELETIKTSMMPIQDFIHLQQQNIHRAIANF